jgi:arginyl-tRNA synthetase
MKDKIQKLLSKALKEKFEVDVKPEDIHLEHPHDESHGDWATNTAISYDKTA